MKILFSTVSDYENKQPINNVLRHVKDAVIVLKHEKDPYRATLILENAVKLLEKLELKEYEELTKEDKTV